jgi:hypothetical protein
MDKTAKSRGGGGGKLNRSETVTIRLDPKLRYLTELAARKQRRTLSSFIEWAIASAIDGIILCEDAKREETLGHQAEKLWDIDEPDRFAKLAQNYPELLTHDEQVLWKLIRECSFLWYQGVWDEGIPPSLKFHKLREQWDALNRVASGEADKSILQDDSKPRPQTEEMDFAPPLEDEDIPF